MMLHMKNIILLVSILLAGTLAQAQSASDPLSAGNKAIYGIVKTNLIKAAEKMDDGNYSFKPTPEVRSFGQIVGHVADAQYTFCSAASGAKNPAPGIENTKTSQADLAEAHTTP